MSEITLGQLAYEAYCVALGAGYKTATGDAGYGYKVNGGTFTNASGTVNLNDTVAPCVNRSSSNSTATTATVTIGGVSDTYSVTTVAGESYSDILFHWDAENTLVADKGGVTATNTGSVFSSTAKTGMYSIARDSNSDYTDFTINTSHFVKAGGQIGFWFYNDNGYQAGSGNYIVTIGDTVNDTMRFQMHSSGGISLRWVANGASAAVAEYTTALSASTWYYIVGYWHPGDSGKDLRLTIYAENGSVVGTGSAATISAMSDDPIQIRFGSAPGDAFRDNMDNIIISNDVARDMWAINATRTF